MTTINEEALKGGSAEDLPRELVELGEAIAALDAGESANAQLQYDRVVNMVKRRRRILTLVQEALSQLRLDVKYLMFDLEATKSERDELQSRLQNYDLDF